MTIPYPDKPWVNEQQFSYTTSNGDLLVGTYFAATNSWSFANEGVVSDDAVFTFDVYTANVAGNAKLGRAHFDQTQPVNDDLVTQQDVNWYLNDEIDKFIYYGPFPPPPVDGEQIYKLWFNTTNNELNVYNFDADTWVPIQAGDIIYYGNTAPDEVLSYELWFDTDALELLIWYNEQWFPVSIPPAQLQAVAEIIEGLEVSVTQVRGDIALNKSDIDENMFDLTERIDEAEERREELRAEYDGKLATLEEEIEQLAPSLERGTWEFTLDSEPGVGKYTLVKEKLDADAQNAICSNELLQCLADAAGNIEAQQECSRNDMDCTNAVVPLKIVTTNDFSEAIEVIFNATDYNGVEHTFAGIDPDHLLDLFNESDDSYLVGDITSDSGGVFEIDVMTSRGNAVGLASLKIFKHEGSVDFDQYVRKQGDTMSGKLVIERPRTSNNTNSFVINGRVDGAETVLLKDYQRESDSSRSDFIEYFGESISPNCLVNVQYVKDYIEEQFNKIPGSDIPDPPKYFKWSIDNNADVSSGYFTGPPSRNNDDPRLNANSTVWISMPDQFGNGFQASTQPRTFGWGTTITVYQKIGSNDLRIGWTAQIKSIRMAENTQVLEVKFDNLVLINWMSTNSLYRVHIGGLN